jgi:hypothetical protein
VLGRFGSDDEAQVRGVLHDLCENRLLIAAGSGASVTYRAASDEELGSLRHARGNEGLEELLWALVYREGPLDLEQLVARTQIDATELQPFLERLVETGRVEASGEHQARIYDARSLVVPLGSSKGWEAAIFDHFKALVITVTSRLGSDRTSPSLRDRVGGSTYTLDVWPGHPFETEVYESLENLRSTLGNLRERVEEFNRAQEVPENHTRVVLYAGQCPIPQGSGETDGME